MSDSEDISESTFDALVEQAVQARAGNAGGPRRACIDAGAAAQQGAGGNPPPSVSVHQPPPACPQASESLTASAAAAPCPSEPTAGRVEQQGQQPPATAQHPEKRAAPALSPNAAPPATRRVPASFSLPPGQHAGHHRQPLAVLPQQPQPQPPGHTAGAAAAADQHPQPAKAASSTAGGSGASSHSSSTSTSLQPITYQGKTLYANTVADVDRLAGDVLKLSPQVIGFDAEWKPSFVKGQPPRKVALLQLCYCQQDGRDTIPAAGGANATCMLLHVAYTGITPNLLTLLASEDIAKVGVNITGDAHKLHADFGVRVAACCELGTEANRRILVDVTDVTAGVEVKRWSLAGLCAEVLRLLMQKEDTPRLSNWELNPLLPQQRHYAACDAYASLALQWAIQVLPLRPTPTDLALAHAAQAGAEAASPGLCHIPSL